ncbi:EF-hand domain-containing protein [Sphingopyxis indica]|uniref:EF-hand domain-containing protein n=1 Tax=Sphingopyxis indica TaxID=436663 RepID=UPI001482D0A8|nr:EF-hand domain-containing protein [Sphingopyxis indica]
MSAAPTPVFDRADSNGDGYVDQAELAALKGGRSQPHLSGGSDRAGRDARE